MGQAPPEPAQLRPFRIGFGLLGLVGALRLFWHGWVEELYAAPARHFAYWGAGLIRPWPELWMLQLHFGLLALSGLMVAAGRRPAPWRGLFALLFIQAKLWDQAAYLNHDYLVALLALLFWAGAVAGDPPWLLTALRLQVGLVWLLAGLAKLQPDWLLAALPLRLWLPTRAGLPVVGPLLALPEAAFLASWAGAAIDLAAMPALCWRRSRPWAMAALAGFHLATGLLFPRIGLFPLYMILATLLFLEPGGPPRGGWVGPWPGPPTRLGRAAFAAYFALQLALPLRPLLYPGPVLWNDLGARFGWRVMLVERSGWLEYEVESPGGRTRRVGPRAMGLTDLQARQMATQPDMILQGAHWLAEAERAAGRPGARVRADAWLSVNGRPAAPFVDPGVDLGSERRGLAPPRWVLPAPW